MVDGVSFHGRHRGSALGVFLSLSRVLPPSVPTRSLGAQVRCLLVTFSRVGVREYRVCVVGSHAQTPSTQRASPWALSALAF